MYFEKSEIETKLICTNCQIRFDEPKVLPCGECICKSCLAKLKNNDSRIIKCPICKREHDIPSDGEFPTHRILADLLKLKPVKVYRGDLLEKLDAKLKSIKNKIDKFFKYLSINSQENQIREHCNSLHRDIENCHSSNECDDLKDQLLNEVHLYEAKCIENLKKHSLQKEYIIKCFESANIKLGESYNLLSNQESLNEQIVENLLNSSIILDNKLQNSAIFFESLLFTGKYLVYKDKIMEKKLKTDAYTSSYYVSSFKELKYEEFTYIDILNIDRLTENHSTSKSIIKYRDLCLNKNNQTIKGIWLALFTNRRLVINFSIQNQITNQYEMIFKLMNSNGELLKEKCDCSNCELIIMTTSQTSVIVALRWTNDNETVVNYKLVSYDLDLNLRHSRFIDYKPMSIHCTDCFIYVLSDIEPFVHVHDWNLKVKFAFGQDTDANEPYFMPNLFQIYVREEQLYVRDQENVSIKVFDLSKGNLIKKIDINLVDCLLHIDSIERIIVINQDSKILYIFDDLGKISFEFDLTFIETITTFCIADNGHLLINDGGKKVLHII